MTRSEKLWLSYKQTTPRSLVNTELKTKLKAEGLVFGVMSFDEEIGNNTEGEKNCVLFFFCVLFSFYCIFFQKKKNIHTVLFGL